MKVVDVLQCILYQCLRIEIEQYVCTITCVKLKGSKNLIQVTCVILYSNCLFNKYINTHISIYITFYFAFKDSLAEKSCLHASSCLHISHIGGIIEGLKQQPIRDVTLINSNIYLRLCMLKG